MQRVALRVAGKYRNDREQEMAKKKRRRWVTWVLAAAALAAAGATVLVTGPLRERSTADTAQPGDTVTAFIGDLSAGASASGTVRASRESWLSVGTPARVEAVHVRVGDRVQAGDALMELDATDLALNLAQAEIGLELAEANLDGLLEAPASADVVAAEAAVASAQANLDELLAGPSEAQQAASEASLRASEASLWSASAELANVRSSVSEAQVKAAEAALLAAQVRYSNARDANHENPNQQTHEAMLEAQKGLASAEAQLDVLRAGPDGGQLGSAQASVAGAAARVDGSQADLNLLALGASRAQLASAELQLAQARSTLASQTAGPSEAQVRAAQAQIEQARLTLADATEALDQTTLVAPHDAVVMAVNFSEGEHASGPSILLAATDGLQVVLEVDEMDVGELAIGQEATITLEAWPADEIPSRVIAIAPTASSSAGSAVVTYQVTLRLEETGRPVLIGMTASANLITAQRRDVLLAPNEAINVDRAKGIYSVNVVRVEAVEEVQVTVGLHDRQFTQVTSGLNAGDVLLVGDVIPSSMMGPGSGSGFMGRMGGDN